MKKYFYFIFLLAIILLFKLGDTLPHPTFAQTEIYCNYIYGEWGA
jgi:hypothetical protein